MPEATFNFPRGFAWGTATSSHQVEGDNKNNNWYAWEQEDGRILHGHKSGLACDWWGGRWKEDFDRAAEGGQNAHRLSIEWSRVQPEPDRWDEQALDHYRQIVRGLDERGLLPVVTLHHFSEPLWFAEMGGWEHEEAPALFERYTAKVVEALRGLVSTWCTINEPNVLAAFGYVTGEFPPGKTDLNLAFAVMENLAKAHARAYARIKVLQPESQVGLAVNWWGFEPARAWHPLDRAASGMLDRLFNNVFPDLLHTGAARLVSKTLQLPEVRGTQDFFGLNYYTGELVRFAPLAAAELFHRREFPQGAELSENGFHANRPELFGRAIKWAVRYGLPVIITENGTEDSQDDFRRRYLVRHVHQVWRAVNFNYPVRGYFHWSLVDNFEWERGWTQRFGLYELDTATQARRPRPSAELYAAVCKSNALSSEMVRKWAPSVFGKLFPG